MILRSIDGILFTFPTPVGEPPALRPAPASRMLALRPAQVVAYVVQVLLLLPSFTLLVAKSGPFLGNPGKTLDTFPCLCYSQDSFRFAPNFIPTLALLLYVKRLTPTAEPAQMTGEQ